MAGVTTGTDIHAGMDGINVAIQPEVKGADMGRTVGTTDTGLEASVAIGTEAGLMTAGTGLLVAAGSQGVGDMEITGVTVDHVVAEGALLISKTGDVTLHAVTLGMASGTVHGLTLGHAAVVTRPHGAVGVDGSEDGHFRVGLIVTDKAGFGVGDNTGCTFNVTGAAIHPHGVLFNVGLVVKAHIGPNDRNADQEQCEQ